jgi:GcrA cell cycle regulator
LTFISEYQKLMGKASGDRLEEQEYIMEQINWAPEHSDALREYVGRGMAFSEIVDTINAKFKTAYSRNAAIGRARRMGLAGPDRPQTSPRVKPRLDRPQGLRSSESRRVEFHWPLPAFEKAEPVELRCVEIEPRHLSLIELDCGDCRYPYGGDSEGEAITFCGHPRRPDSSYCTPHFHLSRNPDLPLQQTASSASLRVVEAA